MHSNTVYKSDQKRSMDFMPCQITHVDNSTPLTVHIQVLWFQYTGLHIDHNCVPIRVYQETFKRLTSQYPHKSE